MQKIDRDTMSAAQFLELVKRSELVSKETCSQAFGSIDLDDVTSDDLSESFVEAGLLTSWQARKLLKGMWKDFFLGKYELLEQIGSGGMGIVYRGRHTTLDNNVAIKLLPRKQLRNDVAKKRFYREARAAAQLNHPNITRTFDVDQSGAFHYLVMEFIEGESLAHFVQNHGTLEFEQAAEYTRQAAKGLANAHDNGLVHRDIKPLNLMLDQNDTVKILDFGLARKLSEETASSVSDGKAHCIGTADYIAPEQAINSHEVDGRADIYGLGHTLYYLLTGAAPFPTGTKVERIVRHCQSQPDCISTLRPNAPVELVAIWKKMTRKHPKNRYANANELIEDLDAFLNGAPLVHIPTAIKRPVQSSAAQPNLVSTVAGQGVASSFDELPVSLDDLPYIADDSGDLLSMDLAAFESSADAAGASTFSDADMLSSPWETNTASALGQSSGQLMPAWSNTPSDSEKPMINERKPHKLGDYPLWLCIIAGVSLSISAILIFFAVVNSIQPDTKIKLGNSSNEVRIESRTGASRTSVNISRRESE